MKKNAFHPLVYINGEPVFGENVYIGLFSEINAKGAEVLIGDNCDIASFVSINVADSHKMTLGMTNNIERDDIVLENNVFVGSHSFIGKGTHIGHHSVVAAGTIAVNIGKVEPYSLIVGNPAKVLPRHYQGEIINND